MRRKSVQRKLNMKDKFELDEKDIDTILLEWCAAYHEPVRKVLRGKVGLKKTKKGFKAVVILKVKEKE